MNEPSLPLAVRPQEQLLIDLLPELHVGRLLSTTAGRAQFAHAYALAHPEQPATCWFLDLYQHDESLAAVGPLPGNLQFACTSDLPSGEVDIAVLALSRQGNGELTRELLQQAHERLAIGARLVAAIDNPTDQWLHELLRKQYDKVTRRPLESGVVYLATKKAPLKKLKHYDAEFTIRDNGKELLIVSRAGVFSHRELDNGAKALINALYIEEDARVLDIGCGSGAVALVSAARSPQASVHAIDSNPRAVECVLAGAEKNGLANVTAALDCDGRSVGAGEFDLVVANPPYFSNFRLAEVFVRIARHGLRPNGMLQLVTKTPRWYEQHLPDHGFEDVEVQPVRGYVIVAAYRSEEE